MSFENNHQFTVRQIVTHRSPDLDAVLSIYLLRNYAIQRYPGVNTAPIVFMSAEQLSDGKTNAASLEKEGVLAVDIGGGRFDTHPVSGHSNVEKSETCASQLVAEDLGLSQDIRFRFLLPFVVMQDSRGESLKSRDATHHLMAPPSLLDGLHRLLQNDELVVEHCISLLEGFIKSASEAERPREETAQRFDRALAAWLENEYQPEAPYERRENIVWESEGLSHYLAKSHGWERRRDLEKLLLVAARLLHNSENALPVDEAERRILLPECINGLALMYGEEHDLYRKSISRFLASLVRREADWFSALREVKRSARVIKNQGNTLVAIASRNGLVIKAVRYKLKAEAVLYYEPESGAVTVQSNPLTQKKSVLNMPRLVARLRTAEHVKQHKKGAVQNPDEIGLIEGWFLHTSANLINRGSPKAPDVQPTVLSYQELIDLVRGELFPEDKLPDFFCPQDSCTLKQCAFYPLRLSNCFAHRQRLINSPKKGTLGELFAEKFD